MRSAEAAARMAAEVVRVFEAAEEQRQQQGDDVGERVAAEVAAVAAAGGKVMVYGVGREGLVLRALCMRLAHLGLRAAVVGDMAAPPLGGAADLFIASAGPGSFSTVDALVATAARCGARVLILSAVPDPAAAAAAAIGAIAAGVSANIAVAVLPARTLSSAAGSDDDGGQLQLLPMGSAYEAALFFLGEIVVAKLRPLLGETEASMRRRHTNME